jgi:hypothetical protein
VGQALGNTQGLVPGIVLDLAICYYRQTVLFPDDRPSRLTKNSFGRRANDAGPIWLGERLSSAKNDAAYTAVVYNMNRNASTESFRRGVEKHMRPAMDLGGIRQDGLVLLRVGVWHFRSAL